VAKNHEIQVSKNGFMKDNSAQRIAEKIFQYADLENNQVLEIGCGKGRITSLLVGKPKQLIAIEPDVKAVREAQKMVSGADFRIGSGDNLEFPDEYFDIVIFVAPSVSWTQVCC